MIDLKALTIQKALEQMEKGELTSEALVSAYLEQVKKVDGDVHAYLEVYADALESAKAADLKRAKGEKGALLGIPFAIKDKYSLRERGQGQHRRFSKGMSRHMTRLQ